MRKLLPTLLIAATLVGCEYKVVEVSAGANKLITEPVVKNIVWCNKCSLVAQLKVASDGEAYGIKMPSGDIHPLRFKTCQEAQELIAGIIDDQRKNCRECSANNWKEVECQ